MRLNVSGWQRAVTAAGGAKVVAGLGLAALVAAMPYVSYSPRQVLMLAHVVAFGASAAALLGGAERDRRAALLGTVLLLEASAFADRLFEPLQQRSGLVFDALRALFSLRPDAFAPYYLWAFVWEFPRTATFGAVRTVTRLMTSVALMSGIALFALSLVKFVAEQLAGGGAVAAALTLIERNATNSLYWNLLFLLSLLAFPVLVIRARAASGVEQRRAKLLVTGLAAFSAVPLLWALLVALWPAFAATMTPGRVGWIVWPSLLAVPAWAAYAVLVHQALDVRLVVRRAMRYALERQTVVALAAIPFIALAIELWRRRHESVVSLFTTTDGAMIASLVAATLVAVRGRRVALEFVDRRFFREQYDARHILGKLVDQCRRATSRRELADVLRDEIDRALHVESVHLLLADRETSSLASLDDSLRPLGMDSELVRHARASNDPLDTQPDSSNPLVSRLPPTEQAWLVDNAARLIIPLTDADGNLSGLLLLGEKRSELPYSAEDRSLLATVGSAAALSLAYVSSDPLPRTPDAGAPTVDADNAAFECHACGLLQPTGKSTCHRCGGAAAAAHVPLVVAGKFRIIERVGRGAMGLVYRALDVHLERSVAVKTLPRLQPDEAWRLRREAKAIASVSHPNLALIYGAESWHGTPMLVLEFLSGGTLAERLARGRMPVPATIAMGRTLADVIGAIHRAGILHRDIKPSNIAFTSDGTPKLLDFGIARLLGSSRRNPPSDREARRGVRVAVEGAANGRSTFSSEGQLVGTPLYMSPEAVDGMAPEPAFDVWAICVSLYEAVSGASPFMDISVPAIFKRISACNAPDLRTFLPDAPAELAEFFVDAFSPNQRNRPATGDELAERLRSLRL